MPHPQPYLELLTRVAAIGFAPEVRRRLESCEVVTAGDTLRVRWRGPRPLELLHPLPGLALSPAQLGNAARAIVELNARLAVPGFGLDGRGRLVWCTMIRPQREGVELATLRAHVDLAVDMVALGVRHFDGILGATVARTATGS